MTKTRNLILALIAVLLVVGVSSPACAKKREPEKDLAVPVSGVMMVGDSMTDTAKAHLRAKGPNWYIDAVRGRGVTELPVRINAYLRSHDVPPAIAILALGTNEQEGWTLADYRAAVRLLPSNTRIVFVNTYRPVFAGQARDGRQYSAWMDRIAQTRNLTTVADWRSAAMADPTLIGDGLHQSATGAKVWANLVFDAMRRVKAMR